MRKRWFHYFLPDFEVLSRLESLEEKSDLILVKQEALMAAIDDLQAAVTAEDTVIDSAIVLIQGIPDLIAAAGVDPEKLEALRQDIFAKSQALATAVAANTTVPAPAPVAPAAPTT